MRPRIKKIIILHRTFTLHYHSKIRRKKMNENPPETKRKTVTEELHGVEITDPYRWLEENNE